MKKMMVLICGLLLYGIVPAGEVTFLVKKFQSNEGKVAIGIYSDPETFLEEGLAVDCQAEPIQDLEAKIVCQLEAGTYAAVVYHDEDDNGELDTNFIGIPNEDVGFSRDATGTLGPPDFEDAAFVVGEEKLELMIHLVEF